MNEVNSLKWLNGKLTVPNVSYFRSINKSIVLLLSALDGKDASRFIEDQISSERLLELLSKSLKSLHELRIVEYSINQSLYFKIAAEKRNYELGLVDESDFMIFTKLCLLKKFMTRCYRIVIDLERFRFYSW